MICAAYTKWSAHAHLSMTHQTFLAIVAKCRPGGLSNAPPQEVGNLFVGKEDTLFAGKESPGRSVSREMVCLHYICCTFAVTHLSSD